MKSAFERDDLMTILDGIDDAVVKLDGQANLTAMNQVAASLYHRLALDRDSCPKRPGPAGGRARSRHSHTASRTRELLTQNFLLSDLFFLAHT
jgi:hypothetical protein